MMRPDLLYMKTRTDLICLIDGLVREYRQLNERIRQLEWDNHNLRISLLREINRDQDPDRMTV